MAELPEERKPDFSNFPRGAIGIKGLPVNRNTRLPSIRTPRDLTLGTPKRTFTPNIPVRREKRPTEPVKDGSQPESRIKNESKTFTPKIPDRGRGRGKNKGNIIQTEGAVFGSGIAASTPSSRGKYKESSPRSGSSHSERKSPMKMEKVNMSTIVSEMDMLLRDDFIDDRDDDKDDDKLGNAKPIIFPIPEDKKEDFSVVNKVKTEATDAFINQDFAKEMGFDVTKIAKFIKKEKNDDAVEEPVPVPDDNLPQAKISEILRCVTPQLLLLRFPQCVTAHLTEAQQKGHNGMDTSTNEQNNSAAGSLSSLPEGQIGKLQIMKSGHARLVIGSLYYNLDSISSLKSIHEIVSVETDSDSNDMTILGNVKKKLNFAPDIENILS